MPKENQDSNTQKYSKHYVINCIFVVSNNSYIDLIKYPAAVNMSKEI